MCLLAAICGMSSCHEKDDGSPDDGGTNYPVTIQLGQRTCEGTIISMPNPPTGTSEPPLPGMVLGLETETESYILSYNGHWESEDKITIDGTEYAVGDRVEITGMASSTRISDTQEYLQLEILTIAKTSPVTTVLGQRTCEGTIVSLPNPPTGTSEPPLPGMVLGLETDTESYILSYNGHWESEDKITIDGTEYAVGDRVVVTGTASETVISSADKYLELEIAAIQKRSAGQ